MDLWNWQFYAIAFPVFILFCILNYLFVIYINKFKSNKASRSQISIGGGETALNIYIVGFTVFALVAEIAKDLVAFYGWNNTKNTESTVARMYWYLPFQLCSILIFLLIIFAICRLISNKYKKKFFWQEYSFIMILCITGYLFTFNIFAPGVMYHYGYFAFMIDHNALDKGYYLWANWFLSIHNLIFHAVFASFGFTLFFINKPRMTNKLQLLKICRCTTLMFAIIITVAYCSCFVNGHNGDLNYINNFAEVRTGFFFDDTKVPVPIRSLFSMCAAMGGFVLWYLFLMFLDKKTNISQKLFFNKNTSCLYL